MGRVMTFRSVALGPPDIAWKMKKTVKVLEVVSSSEPQLFHVFISLGSTSKGLTPDSSMLNFEYSGGYDAPRKYLKVLTKIFDEPGTREYSSSILPLNPHGAYPPSTVILVGVVLGALAVMCSVFSTSLSNFGMSVMINLR